MYFETFLSEFSVNEHKKNGGQNASDQIQDEMFSNRMNKNDQSKTMK